jgi:hypothetical protein
MLSPLIGIIASSGGAAASASSYESIATTTVGSGGSSSVTFSSIPSTYTHLQIRCLTGDSIAQDNSGLMYFNSDTTNTNYRMHYLDGNGSAVGAGSLAAPYVIWYPGKSPNFGITIIDILDYTNTNKNTTCRALNGFDANGSGTVDLISSLWLNTAAITSITLDAGGSALWQQYSSFALYGIKGA